MLYDHFCLIALVLGVTSCKDSGGGGGVGQKRGAELQRPEQGLGWYPDFGDTRQQEELKVARPQQHIHLHAEGQVCGLRLLLLDLPLQETVTSIFYLVIIVCIIIIIIITTNIIIIIIIITSPDEL